MRNKDEKNILPDKPLENPDFDRLGYKDFSKHLAESILKMSSKEGFVIALYGQWGTGKTTITNFITHHLQKEPPKKRPIIIKFNPWWFSGEENLIRHFFQQLRISIEKEKVLGEKIGKELSKNLGLFMDTISDIATELDAPKKAHIVINGIKKILGQPTEKTDLVLLKKKIGEKLQKSDKKILVVIDDIDRLTGEEIRQIFKLVKAVADFPNLVYLLSFDKKVAIKSLKKVQDLPGEEYLEKIVQAPFEVPLPERSRLNTLLVEKLKPILNKAEDEEFDNFHWQNVYFGGLENYITTPRKVIQLYNAFSVTYPAVQGEVNNIDFIAIECIRIFNQEVYDVIRQNPKKFAGTHVRSSSSSDTEIKDLKDFHNGWMKSLPEKDQKILKHILPMLFPKLNEVYGGYNFYSGDERKWRLLNRVCHSESFPTYFRLAVSSNAISTLEIKGIITLTSDEKAFAKRLKELSQQKFSDGKTHLREVLERLRDYAFEKIPEKNITNIINVFFDIGDSLLIERDKGQDMFDYDNSDRIGRLLWPLLKRNNKETNFQILKTAIKKGKSLSTIGREVAILGQQQTCSEIDNLI